MKHPASNRPALIVAVLLTIMAIMVLITAYGYRGGSGVFPRFIGWIFVGLCLAECAMQFKVFIRQSGTLQKTPFKIPETVFKELRGFLWLVFLLADLYLIGFMAGIPLYIFTYLRLSAGRSYRQCVIMSVMASIFVYVLFVQLLQYRLYAGILFGA